MIESYNSKNLPQVKNHNSNKKLLMENLKNKLNSSNISINNQFKYMEHFIKKSYSTDTGIQYERSIDSNDSVWENQSESDNSLLINNNDFSYRNEKKYYELLEKHRIRQDKIKKLSTRTSNNLLNNEFGIKNKVDISDRLPKITKTSYQVLSGFCQRNCPLASAKEIINDNFNDNYERELRRKNRLQQKSQHHRLKKAISYPLPETKNISDNINKEIKGKFIIFYYINIFEFF